MSTTTPPTTWAVDDLFRDPDEGHLCCDCCDGWCIRAEEPEAYKREPLHHLGEGDEQWVSDKYTAIRAHLLTDDLVVVAPEKHAKVPDSFAAPEDIPGQESAQRFTPSIVAPLLTAGIAIHERGPGAPQPLYHEGAHVGVVMPAPHCATLDDVRRYQRIIADIRRRPRGEGGWTNDPLEGLLSQMGGSPLDNLMKIEQAAAAALPMEAGQA